MWDNVPLLRSITSVLVTLSTVAVLYGAISYAVHQPGVFPLHLVQLSAAPQRVVAEDVLQVVRDEVSGNIFTVDIERLQQSLEKLPWVRSVGIRRAFPDRLVVTLGEHQALARWNGTALVNIHGEVFDASSEEPLPEFLGQDGDSFELTQRYGEFRSQLAALNLQVAQLALTPRHAWRVILDNGMTLELGREEMQQRMARFVAVYPYTEGRGGAHVDLRYRNGLAVRQMAESKRLRNES